MRLAIYQMAMPPTQSRSYNIEDQERMALATNYFAWQAKLVIPELGQRVIEIGCGTGNFTRALLDREAVLALDSDTECIDRIRRQFRDRDNLQTLVCDASELCQRAAQPGLPDLAAFRPDSCVCLNVLEHIEDDRGALQAMASLLPHGGRIVLIVPAFEYLYGPIDRNLGHYRRYSRNAIQALAEASGVKVRKLRYMNFVGFFGWWVNARVLRRDRQSTKQIQVFDRLIAPVLSRFEAILPPPFGQSLFAVLEK